jgi:hypothetical protein
MRRMTDVAWCVSDGARRLPHTTPGARHLPRPGRSHDPNHQSHPQQQVARISRLSAGRSNHRPTRPSPARHLPTHAHVRCHASACAHHHHRHHIIIIIIIITIINSIYLASLLQPSAPSYTSQPEFYLLLLVIPTPARAYSSHSSSFLSSTLPSSPSHSPQVLPISPPLNSSHVPSVLADPSSLVAAGSNLSNRWESRASGCWSL